MYPAHFFFFFFNFNHPLLGTHWTAGSTDRKSLCSVLCFLIFKEFLSLTVWLWSTFSLVSSWGYCETWKIAECGDSKAAPWQPVSKWLWEEGEWGGSAGIPEAGPQPDSSQGSEGCLDTMLLNSWSFLDYCWNLHSSGRFAGLTLAPFKSTEKTAWAYTWCRGFSLLTIPFLGFIDLPKMTYASLDLGFGVRMSSHFLFVCRGSGHRTVSCVCSYWSIK